MVQDGADLERTLALLKWAKAEGALHLKVYVGSVAIECAFPPPEFKSEAVVSADYDASPDDVNSFVDMSEPGFEGRPPFKSQPRPYVDPDAAFDAWSSFQPLPNP